MSLFHRRLGPGPGQFRLQWDGKGGDADARRGVVRGPRPVSRHRALAVRGSREDPADRPTRAL